MRVGVHVRSVGPPRVQVETGLVWRIPPVCSMLRAMPSLASFLDPCLAASQREFNLVRHTARPALDRTKRTGEVDDLSRWQRTRRATRPYRQFASRMRRSNLTGINKSPQSDLRAPAFSFSLRVQGGQE